MRFKLGLIDADFLKYYVAYDIKKAMENGLNIDEMPIEELTNTVHDFTDVRINDIMGHIGHKTDKLIFLFSGPGSKNFRSLIATHRKYKGTRKYEPKYALEYFCKGEVEKYIKNTQNYYRIEELEADDLCTMAHKEGTFIYSNDKDLRNSPGWHFDIKNGKFIKVSEKEGFKSLLKQAMTGDSVDSIPGAGGVGPVRAKKVVEEYDDIDKTIFNTIKEFLKAKKGTPKQKFDTFVEMYSLVNLKTSKGEWLKEKYEDFFNTINNLINDKRE